MTENPRLRTLLELFHHARKQEAIIARLQKKCRELCEDLYDIKTALLTMAEWKVGDILYGGNGDGSLVQVREVAVAPIDPLAMRPEFRYTVGMLDKYDASNDSYLTGSGFYLYRLEHRKYRLATKTEICDFMKHNALKTRRKKNS